jgi:hypothetical protein
MMECDEVKKCGSEEMKYLTILLSHRLTASLLHFLTSA